jgi:hypothetical protein
MNAWERIPALWQTKKSFKFFFDGEDELQTNLDGEVCAQCRSLGLI